MGGESRASNIISPKTSDRDVGVAVKLCDVRVCCVLPSQDRQPRGRDIRAMSPIVLRGRNTENPHGNDRRRIGGIYSMRAWVLREELKCCGEFTQCWRRRLCPDLQPSQLSGNSRASRPPYIQRRQLTIASFILLVTVPLMLGFNYC